MISPTEAALSDPEIEGAVLRVIKKKLSQGSYLRLTVVSNSMAPLLRAGDKVEIAALDQDAQRHLPAGVVIVFRICGRFHIHRLIEGTPAEAKYLQTKGDNSRFPDPPVPRTCVVGKLLRYERSGRWNLADATTGPNVVHPSLRARASLFRRRLFETLVTFAVHTSSQRPLRTLWKHAYSASIHLLSFALHKRAIKYSMYLRRSGATGEIEPGISDLDPLAVLSSNDPAAFSLQSVTLQRREALLGKVMPHSGGLFIFSPEMFSFWSVWGGLRACEMLEWRLLFGDDIRPPPQQAPSIVLRLSCLRELCGCYLYAYSTLSQMSRAPRLPLWIRLIRHLLETVKYSFLCTQSEIDPVLYSSSREKFLEFLPKGALKSTAQSLLSHLRERRFPAPARAVTLFAEVAERCFSVLLENPEIRELAAAAPAVPEGSLMLLMRPHKFAIEIPDADFNKNLDNFFSRPEWPWDAAPFPSSLVRLATLLRPLHGLTLAQALPTEKGAIVRAELAEYCAHFGAAFRPAVSSEFLRLGIYFAALRTALQSGETISTTNQLEAACQATCPQVVTALQTLQRPPVRLSLAEIQGFGGIFTQLLHDCIHLSMRQ